MRKSITNGVRALLVLSPLFVQMRCAFAAAPPPLSGSYVYTSDKFCQMTVIAKHGTSTTIQNTPCVEEISIGGGDVDGAPLASGSACFTLTHS